MVNDIIIKIYATNKTATTDENIVYDSVISDNIIVKMKIVAMTIKIVLYTYCTHFDIAYEVFVNTITSRKYNNMVSAAICINQRTTNMAAINHGIVNDSMHFVYHRKIG